MASGRLPMDWSALDNVATQLTASGRVAVERLAERVRRSIYIQAQFFRGRVDDPPEGVVAQLVAASVSRKDGGADLRRAVAKLLERHRAAAAKPRTTKVAATDDVAATAP